MSTPFSNLLVWFFPLLLVVPASSLMCYSCQSSHPFSECESNVREFRKGLHSKFAVNCSMYSEMEHEYCAIESYYQNGVVNAMIRDCNDNSFSFTFDNYPYIKMKHVNGLSNITVCTYGSGRVRCISLCHTDMCNGPSTAAWTHALTHWTFLSLPCLIGWALLI